MPAHFLWGDRARQLRAADRTAREIGQYVGRPSDDEGPEDEHLPDPAETDQGEGGNADIERPAGHCLAAAQQSDRQGQQCNTGKSDPVGRQRLQIDNQRRFGGRIKIFARTQQKGCKQACRNPGRIARDAVHLRPFDQHQGGRHCHQDIEHQPPHQTANKAMAIMTIAATSGSAGPTA